MKDASAAIYGMNAANGVIIVTTKKGVAEKTRVSYSALFGMKNATGMEETVDAYTYRMLANERARNDQAALNTLTIFWNCIEPGLRVIQTITGLTCL
mgnify:CR=1 FL=1